MAGGAPGDAGGGILQSLRNLGATVIALLRTRLELLATELEEERVRLLVLLCWAAGALVFLAIGVLLLTILLVAVFWDSSHRVTIIVVLAAIFLAIGVGMAVGVRNRMRARPRLFSASLDELTKDKDQLTPRNE